jgi:hypothetical protein
LRAVINSRKTFEEFYRRTKDHTPFGLKVTNAFS